MKPTIDFILVYEPQNAHCAETIETILNTDCVNQLFLIAGNSDAAQDAQAVTTQNAKRCSVLQTDNVNGTKFLRLIAPKLEAKFTLFYLSSHDLKLGYRAIERLLQTAGYHADNFADNDPNSALMLYSDRYDSNGLHPTIDYKTGSLRDDFDFGSLQLIRTSAIRHFLNNGRSPRYRFAGLYALRLFISSKGK